MRYVKWLIVLAVALLLAVFAIANREIVQITFWPLPITVQAPIYVIAIGTGIIGFLTGEFAVWVGGFGFRREARLQARELEALKRELTAANTQLAQLQSRGAVTVRTPVPGAPRD